MIHSSMPNFSAIGEWYVTPKTGNFDEILLNFTKFDDFGCHGGG